MSVNFGTTNTTRYYTVPDHADFTLPDGDWALVFVAKFETTTTNKYLLSTNPFFSTNSINIRVVSSSSSLTVNYNETATLTASAPTEGVFNVIYVTRRSGSLYVGWKPVGGGAGAESSGSSISVSTSNGSSFVIGGRSDFNSDSMWQGSISWAAFIPGKALSAVEAGALADGSTVLMSSAYAGSVTNLWYMESSTPATITDSVNSRIATKVGTGYSADDTDPIPPVVSIVKGVSLVLYQSDATTLQASVTGIKARWWDSATATGAPLTETSTAATDGSGLLEWNINSATSLNVDDLGYLSLYKAGATPNDDLHFSGRVAVSNIV